MDWFDLSEAPQIGNVSFLARRCSVSDWIGSFMTNFTTSPAVNLQTYCARTLVLADNTMAETGMLAMIEGSGFELLFPEYKSRGIQRLLGDLPIKAGLTIVESDTGSGKTEFALAYVSMLIHNGLADGVVFGLPTQTTANGLFARIGNAVDKSFPDSCVTLAHGKAKYNPEYFVPDENGFLKQSNKRTFLGSMSVATVDQILMGVLPMRHMFVRAFETRKSVLILDENHSFDAYMNALVECVLKGQHDAFSSVILLSATLPLALKSKLISTYAGKSSGNQYPLLTHVGLMGETTTLSVLDSITPKTVRRELWWSNNLLPNAEQCRQLIDWAEQGAMAAVICNTVQDAQFLHSTLSKQTALSIDLFHARYTIADPIKIERAVLNKYGKNAPRSGGLLIATQVAEQSLDLDFDVLVSEIAPIEFLLQRMGRLWRYGRSSGNVHLATRTTQISAPLLITLCPNQLYSSGDIRSLYGSSGYVYKNIRALYRSQQYMEGQSIVVFPDCYRRALDFVPQDESYGSESAELSILAERFKIEEEGRVYAAKGLSNQQSKPLKDVDTRAALLTRDGEMSRSVVLFSEPNKLLYGEDYEEQADRELNTVSLSKKWRNVHLMSNTIVIGQLLGKVFFIINWECLIFVFSRLSTQIKEE